MTDHLAFIIEDDPDASAIFSKALEVQGFKTEAIHDGEKALERLRTTAPFVIVLDLHLPNVDGTEILAWVRSMPALKETLVIVVTADARMGELLEDKADLVLLKPATFTQIRDFTARLISRKLKALEAAAAPPAVESAPTPEVKPTESSAPVENAAPSDATSEVKPAEVPTPAIILAEAIPMVPTVSTEEEAAKDKVA